MFTQNKEKKGGITVFDMVVFSMLGAIMFASKLITELLPNIHLLGMFTMAFTLVFRVKALLPIYIFVAITGIYAGFSFWWIPYLYIWAVLWLFTMLLPKNMPTKIKAVVYPLICALHGFLYGTLYAPAQALMFGLDFSATVAWIIAGLPFDLIHGISNLIVGTLILPFSRLLSRLYRAHRQA